MKASNKDYDGDDGNNDSTPASSIMDTFNNSEWTKIGDAKTYTPVAEDVGSRLRIEVTALSTADNSVMAGPVAVLTEPVLSQPGRPPKRSLQTIPGSGTGIAGAVRFRVVSYNILAELYATKQVRITPFLIKKENIVNMFIILGLSVLRYMEFIMAIQKKDYFG